MNKKVIKIILLLVVVLGVSQICLGETPDSAIVADIAKDNDSTEMTKAIMKFVTVMVGVMVSSFAIFIGLSIWNAILSRSRSKNVDYDLSLKAPQSVDEAVLMFIHKNRLK